jgi:uncharacterized protein YigE (DUF2233 family)
MAGRVQGGVRIPDPKRTRGRLPGALAALASALAAAPSLAGAPEFRPIAGEGLAYDELERGGTVYHLLRVDLARHPLRVADARREGRRAATVDELGREAKALVALNGTFFDEDYRPLGLVASAGRELNPLRNVSWWAAFLVREHGSGGSAEILTTAQLQAISAAERGPFAAAVQAGPRTVSAGQPVKLKEQSAARSAVCVLDPTHVILLATEGTAVESNALAALMAAEPAEGGLACEAGLMFDGGPSTQLWIEAPGLSRFVRGGWAVPNALVVLPSR